MKIINFGSLNVDYVYHVDEFLRPGETKQTKEREIFAGGKGLNQSIALARAGAAVYHAGIVGKDGEILKNALESANVNTNYLLQMDMDGGHTIIQINAKGENCILLYGGTNQRLTEEYIDDVLDNCSQEDFILLQNETNLVEYIIEKAAQKGMRVAFNAAPMDRKVREYPLEKLEWLFVNEIEGGDLAKESEYRSIIETLTRKYPNSTVVLTLGKDGVWYKSQKKEIRLSACKVKEIVDTTAAGDTFIGYFLAGMLQKLPEKQALTQATVASALAIGKKGAAGSVPCLAEVNEAMDKQSIPEPREIPV